MALFEPLVGEAETVWRAHVIERLRGNEAVVEAVGKHLAVARSGKVMSYTVAESIEAPFTPETAKANEECAKTWAELCAAYDRLGT